jgi:hypothetical protein
MRWTDTDIDDDSYEPNDMGEHWIEEAHRDEYDNDDAEPSHESDADEYRIAVGVDEMPPLPAVIPFSVHPRWTPRRVLWLLIALIFIAMLLVYMVLPWLQWVLRPDSTPPLVPPVNL